MVCPHHTYPLSKILPPGHDGVCSSRSSPLKYGRQTTLRRPGCTRSCIDLATPYFYILLDHGQRLLLWRAVLLSIQPRHTDLHYPTVAIMHGSKWMAIYPQAPEEALGMLNWTRGHPTGFHSTHPSTCIIRLHVSCHCSPVLPIVSASVTSNLPEGASNGLPNFTSLIDQNHYLALYICSIVPCASPVASMAAS